MLPLAAPGDTWGISGPDFLRAYLAALVVMVAVAIAMRIRVTRADLGVSTTQPTPGQVALLDDGPDRAVYASLAGLRAVGAVGVGNLRQLTTDGAPPAGLSRLDQSVYDAARRHVQIDRLGADHRVRSALDELQTSVERAGWLLDPSQRSQARLGGWLVAGLATFGAVRIVAGIANDKPVGFLVILTIAAAITTRVLLRAPRLSAAGKNAVAASRRTHSHLNPSQSPSWSTYGLAGAAMGVALFGTASLWAADPAFAETAGLKRTTESGGISGYSGGGDGGAGDAGGGGCGGGGGGCGGGCGG